MVDFETIFGATPIEDVSDLIPTHITNRKELNEWEAANILQAVQKYLTKRRKFLPTIDLIRQVHKEMFDQTWSWAGKFRNRNLNIGTDWHKIQEELKILCDDIRYWQENKSELAIFQQSVRLHHRLVKIHPFINGNGRHARLVSDLFLFSHNHKLPKWPNQELIEETTTRKQYIEALQAADQGNYTLLEEYIKKLLV